MFENLDDEEARAERFGEAMAGRSLTWLARELGVAVSTVSSYARGKAPSGLVAWRIASVLGIDLAWYLVGVAPAAREEGAGIVRIPVLAGAAHRGSMPFDGDYLATLGADPSRSFVTGVGGSAMEPTIPSESDVLVVRGGGVLDGEPHAIRHGESMVIRRLQVLSGGGLMAVCDNPAFAPEPVGGVDDVVGRVALVLRRFPGIR